MTKTKEINIEDYNFFETLPECAEAAEALFQNPDWKSPGRRYPLTYKECLDMLYYIQRVSELENTTTLYDNMIFHKKKAGLLKIEVAIKRAEKDEVEKEEESEV